MKGKVVSKAGGYKQNNFQKEEKFAYPINESIRCEEVFVISDDGEKIGVLKTVHALALAKESDLDLVLVSPNAKPPVARIVSWSKFKYQLEKKQKDGRKSKIEQKEMWFKAFIGDGDLNHKIKRVKEFLDKGSSVKLVALGKGRVNFELLKQLMDKVLGILQEYIEEPEEIKKEGKNISVIVRIKKNHVKTKIKDAQSDDKKV